MGYPHEVENLISGEGGGGARGGPIKSEGLGNSLRENKRGDAY